jgi:hypothetical protein
VYLVCFALVASCGHRLPLAPRGAQPADAFVDVPAPPPPPHVERVPPRPDEAVWVDGSWQRAGARWRWHAGGWFERPPRGVVFTDWALVRDGTRLLFAAAAWRDAHGAPVVAPKLLAEAQMADGATAPDAGELEPVTPLDAGAPEAGALDLDAAPLDADALDAEAGNDARD